MANSAHLTEYAALRRHREEMQAAGQRQRRHLLFGLVIAGLISTAGYWITPPLGLMLAGISAMGLFFASLTGGSSVPAHVLSGIEGEVRTLKALQQLPADYLLFNQIFVADPWLPNGRRELDFIVIGPGEVTVVEVKNTPGIVYVAPDKKHWQVARRAGCGSRPGWNAMDNPIIQVQAQADALQRWMLTFGLSIKVRSVVCLANPGVIIENSDQSPIPIAVPALLQEVLTRPRPDRPLTPSQRKQVISLLVGNPAGTAQAA
jgi:hypothetical protein